MKIAIDASRAINENAGVGRLVKELIEHLLKIDAKNDYVLYFNFFNNFKEKAKRAEAFKRPNSEIKVTRFPGSVKERLLASSKGFYGRLKFDADLYLAPTFLDFDQGLKTPQIVLVHDLSMFRYPEHLGTKQSERYQKLTKIACERSSKIIAISSSTKKDIVDTLGIPETKIIVINPGISEIKVSEKLPLSLEKGGYILNVGTVEPRKNLLKLLDSYALLPHYLREDYPLVIVGASGWNNSPIYKKWRDLNLKESVIFTGFITDEELGSLYKNATCFVYPSLFEGFGLPVAEALSFGLPVLTSNTSSLPEVGGKAVLYANPKDERTIAAGIKKLLTDEKLILKLKKRSKIQAKKFSWRKTAEEVLEVIEKSSKS